jgi:hypothetical protein
MAALLLVIMALGLPLNDLFRYGLLMIAAVVILRGTIVLEARAWLTAVAVVLAAMLGTMLMPAPKIEEGHNVFVVDGRGGALEQGLPADAFRTMLAEFDQAYPAEKRCQKGVGGCWRNGLPDRAFAYSADGLLDTPQMSRRVTGIGFSDPVWLRLGAINEKQYNWYGESDIQRGKRERWSNVLQPWQLTMPYFVMYRLPAEFVGSTLCWQGKVLWEGANETFVRWNHLQPACRPIESGDAGRRIIGMSIGTPLAMSLEANATVQLRHLIAPGLALIGVAAVLLLLVRWKKRDLSLPFVFLALALVVVMLNDLSFISGVRPFDGGDDGLFYEGVGRHIAQFLHAGEWAKALEGDESVYYYGGPGLRYFRALEQFAFGDTFFAYLSLMLALPFLVFLAFKRFFSPRAALGFTLVFIAIPVGAVFGTSFFNYAKWAARGFADPAAAAFFLSGFVVLLGPTMNGPSARFAPAFSAGLLFALALWVRPNLAPATGILLGGAGLAALWQMQVWRAAGLCLGFLPVFGMALHNWHFGSVFVLFSSNATIAEAIPMPPSAWIAMLGELIHFDFGGENIRRGVLQIARWLAGPSESFLMIPLHAAAVAVLLRVALTRGFDPWLRLTAWAMLAQHPVALFYLSADRYYYLTWFITMLVCVVWLRDEGFGLLRQRWPHVAELCESNPISRWLGTVLDWWAGFTGVVAKR